MKLLKEHKGHQIRIILNYSGMGSIYSTQVINSIYFGMICNIIALQEMVKVKRNLSRDQPFLNIDERVDNVSKRGFLHPMNGRRRYSILSTTPPMRAEPVISGEFSKRVSEASSHHMRGANPFTGEFRHKPEAVVTVLGNIASTSPLASIVPNKKVTKPMAGKEDNMGSHELATAREKDAHDEKDRESPGEAASRHRLQLDFSSEAYNRLSEIRVESGAKTNAEVVRSALRLYDWYLEQKRNGFKLQLVKDDILKEVEILL